MPEKVVIVQYDPEWKTQFDKLRAMLSECVGDAALRIEHIGSTSVEGLSAKPIIDLAIVIESMEKLPEIEKRLARIGFANEGDRGIAERYAFRRIAPDEFMKHHLYVCPQNSRALAEQIAFRDYLRVHSEAASEYGALKEKLAERYGNDREGYTNAKTDFIHGILKLARV